MRITDLLDRRSVSLTAAPKTKSETLDMAVDLMVKSEKISNREAYRKQVYLREEESTTGIGEGIAIPHGKCDAVKKPGLAAMVIKNGVEFEALDDEPVTLLFLIAAPNTEDNIHLDVLSKLSVMLMDEEFTESLRNASSVDEFMDIIDRADSEKKDIDERLADTGSTEGTQAKILAVTSCPTGIAHTYMAAEGIEKAAKAKNCFVKIETRGSGGAKNVLTDQEIADADCIIVAADAKVPMERFDGKKVIECQVSDGISKADQLIDRAINGDAPVYHAAAGSQTSSAGNKSGGSVGHKIYMQLMNGVSHMLPLVVGGGILIAIAFLIDGLSVDLSALPADQRANFGTITPVAALFKGIGGTAFGFMLPILAGFIAMAIGDRPALALGLVGGMMAANGKSGFLGALLAGFAAGYIILGLRKLCDKLPEALEKIAPVLIYPVVGILVMGLLMTFIVEPVMGGINTGLNNALTVRIFSVEITVLGNHLRLYPETEFQSKSVDSLCKCRKSTFDLLFIYFPVTKCAPVIISFAKPSIVQNKHIQADVPGFFCNMIQFVCIKIKIGSFPVVYENWSWLFYVFAADQVVSVCIMINARKFSKSFCGI